MSFLNTIKDGKPIASIIIPAFNAEQVLGKCIDSVLAQTYENIEIIVSDDGSQDGTFDLASEYCRLDDRVHVIRRENGGVSAARNRALDKCTGSYVLFVDADDTILTDYVEKTVTRAIITDADIIVSGITYVTDSYVRKVTFTSKGITKETVEDWNQFFDVQETTNLIGYACNKLYKKSFLDKYCLRFNGNKKQQEDLDFIIRAFSKTNKMYLLDESFYLYRFEEKVVKISGSFDVIDNYLMLFDRLFSIGDNPDNRTEQIYHTVTGILYNTLFWCEGYDEIVPFLNKLGTDNRFKMMNVRHKHITLGLVRELMMFFIRIKAFGLAYFVVRFRKNIARLIRKVKAKNV